MSIVLRSRKTLAQRYRGVLKKYGTLSHLWDFGVPQGPLAYAASHTAAEFIAAHPLWPLWQDAAGTVPACKINDPVGLCKDQYGGAHASQTTTTKRPILSGRVNLLTATEDFSSASWTKDGVSLGSCQAPNGASTANTITATVGGGEIYQSISILAGMPRKATFWVRRRSGVGTISMYCATANTDITASVTSTWSLITLTSSTGSTTIYAGISLGTSGDSVDIWHPDIRPSNSPTNIPAYQRVTSATDYDTVGFPVRALFDGVDDCLVVPSLDLSMTDKVTVVAGITKLSDAAAGMILEHGATFGAQGTFYIAAAETSGDYSFQGKGSTSGARISKTGFAAPHSGVLSTKADISGSSRSARVNGGAYTTDTTTLGTGTLSVNALNIGARNGGASSPFNGAIQSLAVIGNLLPDGEVKILEASANAAMGKVY